MPLEAIFIAEVKYTGRREIDRQLQGVGLVFWFVRLARLLGWVGA